MKVRDVMSRNLILGTRKTPLAQLQELMRANAITGVPIAERGRLLGIVSMDDIIKALQTGTIDQPAGSKMTSSVVALEDDMPISFAISRMEKFRFGRFPVLNKDGELVGILTSRDILVHLLLAMNRELEDLERRNEQRPGPAAAQATRRQNSSADKRSPTTRRYSTRRYDFENAGRGSTEVKKMLVDAGLETRFARRVAIAAYELEMNQVCHSIGGTLQVEFGPTMVWVSADDEGPGIGDLDAAMTEGWSTASEWVRSLGFGAGMGLPNTKRVSDEFSIQSDSSGTRVRAGFRVPEKG